MSIWFPFHFLFEEGEELGLHCGIRGREDMAQGMSDSGGTFPSKCLRGYRREIMIGMRDIQRRDKVHKRLP